MLKRFLDKKFAEAFIISLVAVQVCFALIWVGFPSIPLSSDTMPDIIATDKKLDFLKKNQKNKIVFLIFDGLSFRFTNFADKKLHDNKTQEYSDVFTNKMKFQNQLKHKEPKNLIHIQKWVDGPTWTKFCLQSITHGSLPNQSIADIMIESQAMKYDNFMVRAYKQGLKIFFYGDIVWKPLIQGYEYIFSKIKWVNWFSAHTTSQTDEITIDDLITHFENEHDWNFILAHTAQLDHSVHQERLSIPVTEKILKQDDLLIEKLIDKLPQDVTQIITSDHGLIEKGHGGSSPEEKMATFIAYRKKGFPFQDFDQKNLEEILETKIDGMDLTVMMSFQLGQTPSINSLGNVINSLVYFGLGGTEAETEADNGLEEFVVKLLDMNRVNLKQKIFLIENMQEIYEISSKDGVYQAMKSLDARLDAESSNEYKNLPVAEQISMIKNIQIEVIRLQNLLRQLSTYFDYRSTFIHFIAVVIFGITLALKALLNFQQIEPISGTATLKFYDFFESSEDQDKGFIIITKKLAVIITMIVVISGLLSYFMDIHILVGFVFTLAVLNLLQMIFGNIEFAKTAYLKNSLTQTLENITANWPIIIKGLFLILGFIPSNTNQMIENGPVQFFFPLFCLSYVSVEICRSLLPPKSSVCPVAQNSFRISFGIFLAHVIQIGYTSFGDPQFYSQFIDDLTCRMKSFWANKLIYYNALPGLTQIILAKKLLYPNISNLQSKISLVFFGVEILLIVARESYNDKQFEKSILVPFIILAQALTHIVLIFKFFEKFEKMDVLKAQLGLFVLLGQTNGILTILVLFILINLLMKFNYRFLERDRKEIAIDLYAITNLMFYTGGHRSMSSNLCLTCGMMFYDDFTVVSGFFVFMQTVIMFAMVSIGLTIYLNNEIAKDQIALKEELGKETVSKTKKIEFVGFMSIFELLLWFEYIFVCMKFIENKEFQENPHVIGDKFIYASAKVLGLSVIKIFCLLFF